jgi:arsenite methyltransferase
VIDAADPWARWLLERRHGGDPERRRSMLEGLAETRDKVLGNAEIAAGETVLDVGCGDGLIAFGALPLVGVTGRVIFSDISEQLLDVCREIAAGDGRCEFLHASTTDLSALADRSVNVVTTRSVVIYVAEKQRAFEEFYRVLRPGGRLSMFEPINSYAFPQPEDRFMYYDVTEVRELATTVKGFYDRMRGDATLTDFDERDLVALAEATGFREVELELKIHVRPAERVRDWETLERSSGNPLAPTLAEAIDGALSAEEAARFRAHLRREDELGRGIDRFAVAFLRARKR